LLNAQININKLKDQKTIMSGGNMEDLYLETVKGNLPIDPLIIEKYSLEKGTISPFTHSRIVGKHGEFYLEPRNKERVSQEIPDEGFPDDGIDQMDHGFELSTSEMIDIAQGVDSTV
jgi:hypothetical protein